MSERPRTMTAEQWEDMERWLESHPYGAMTLAEIRAERAAHDSSEQTIREQCAKIAEDWLASHYSEECDLMCAEIAAAIRSGK